MNVKAIYKILTELEKALKQKEPSSEALSCEALGIGPNCKHNLMRMLAEEELIAGVGVETVKYTDATVTKIMYHDKYLRLTLKGFEYLHTNSMMKKIRAEEYAYNHEEIERELGYKIEKGEPIECDPMKLSELRKLLEEGWVIIDTKPSVEKHFKYLTLIDSHWIEE